MSILHRADALSVDVEDYFQVEAFASRVPRHSWPGFKSRVADNTYRVLELFARHGHKATFFMLGWVAERNKALVREIQAEGHEVACHGYYHQQVFRLTPEEFRADLRRAKHAIEDAGGVEVVGYRAPTFSICRKSLWALHILVEELFTYDSSIVPVHHDNYGIPGTPRAPHRMLLPGGVNIYEMPISTVRVAGATVPVGGGGYLRLLPMAYTKWALNRLRTREKVPVILYFHPWEIDPEQPRIPAGWRSHLRHYTNLDRMYGRLEEVLSMGQYQGMASLMKELEESTVAQRTSQALGPTVFA